MKKTLLTLSLMAGTLLLTACTAATDMTTATNSPMPTGTATTSPDILPQVTNVLPQMETDVMEGIDGMMDSMTEGATSAPAGTTMPESTGVTSMDKARRVVEQIEDELERLSEVDDAQVVIAGNKAAVALEFDDQYKGGVDERLRGVVKERIDSVISGISTVAISTDNAIMDALETLGERLDTMSDMTALQSDLDAIIKKINAAQS